MFLQPQPLHIFDCFSLFLSFSFYILAPIIISPQVATLCCQSFSLCSGFGVGGKDGFFSCKIPLWHFISAVSMENNVFVLMFTCSRSSPYRGRPAAGDIRWFSPSTADGPSNQWSGGAESIFNKSIQCQHETGRPAQPLLLLLGHLAAQPLQARKSEKPELWQKEGVTRLHTKGKWHSLFGRAMTRESVQGKLDPECCLYQREKEKHDNLRRS